MGSKSGIQDQVGFLKNRPVLEHRVKPHRERLQVADVRGALETPNGALREQSAPQLAVPAHSKRAAQDGRGEDRGDGYRM
jgi:hypothetical protein